MRVLSGVREAGVLKEAGVVHEEVRNCPINEQTADGVSVGRCWFNLPDGKTCPRHGDVSLAVAYYRSTGHCMLENVWRQRRLLSDPETA